MKIKKKNTTIPISGKIVDTENVEDKTSNAPSMRLMEEMISRLIPANAGTHNSIYREKDITDLFYNGTLSNQIAAGTFDDIFVGDYIIGKNSKRKYLVADLDYRFNMGDTATTKHHILMIPEKIMGTAQMNGTNTTNGGYYGSAMYTTNLNQFRNTIKSDFGASHVLNHREILTNAVTDGKASSWAWYDATIELMNECMVYGHNAWGSHHGFESGIDKSQLSLFRLRPDLTVAVNDSEKRQWYWLRDVISSSYFASVNFNGLANYTSASSTGGVRPAFLII